MKRNLFIDSIRGLLLITMLIDHTSLSFINYYTDHPLGFFSAAEGFIFISAYLFGLIYSKYLNNVNMLLQKTMKRVWCIYKYHIASIVVLHLLIYSIIIFIPSSSINPNIFRIEIYSLIYNLKTVLLLKQPWCLDILPLYIILIAFSPIILIGFKYNYKITLLISFTIWALIQFTSIEVIYYGILSKLDINLGAFNIFGWQFLFTIGLFLGYQNFYHNFKISYNSKIVYSTLIIVFTLFIFRHTLPEYNNDLFSLLYNNKRILQPFRLINFMLIAYLFCIVNKYFSNIKLNFFSYIGQYSLDVFTFHLILIYILKLNFNLNKETVLTQIIVGILLILSLIIPAIIKEEYNLKLKKERRARIKSRLALIININRDVLKVTHYCIVHSKKLITKIIFSEKISK
ncbi:OpgC domain-containing protein [Plebeiibacterium sediminum]|uniref:OpgC domain-containing protein n=1 Tax=Plebeiibacterium sediminum TaxID=2992112 RepID=A0AAE3M4F9_9BACT|nr:OpgC domain-containing protein [Plebeiobacterium sediminum]MCW3786635.1 OpgC domain-containing protein [Plebeiobacterium sediminum]